MSREIFEKGEFDRGIFLLNVLAIVFNPNAKLVLIGRREKDPYIPELSWTFPGGRPDYKKDLEDYLKLEVKKKTNLDIKIEKIIFARTYPNDRRFLTIYYLTTPLNAGEEKTGEKFVEIKWVKPEEVSLYFKYPPMSSEIIRFIKELSKQ